MATFVCWVRISETSRVKYMYLRFLRGVPACRVLAVSALRGPFPFQALPFSFHVCMYVCMCVDVCMRLHMQAESGSCLESASMRQDLLVKATAC